MLKPIKIFKRFKGVAAFFSDRSSGNLSFKWSGEKVVANRRKFFRVSGLTLENFIMPEQVHGRQVAVVGARERGRGALRKNWIAGADGLVTKQAGIVLGVETADCLPLFFLDAKKGIIGTAHAGWRGVVANIAAEVVAKFRRLGAVAKDIQVEIGPHIQKCCFRVQSDVLVRFADYKKFLTKRAGGFYIDLSGIVVRQLAAAGVPRKNIKVSCLCTCHLRRFYSYRRDKNKCNGSMVGVVARVR